VQLPTELLDEAICAQAIDDAIVQIISSTEPEHFPTETEVHCRMCNFLEICKEGREWMKRQRGSQAYAEARR
jgi:hypothetical protein